MRYQHTQSVYVITLSFIAVSVIFIVAVARADVGARTVLATGAFLLLAETILLNFSRLTTSIDDENLHLVFGWGWPHKRIALSEVANVAAVRNSWWYGFGVRLTPNGWIYNVWGLDAVHLDLTTGKSFRVGTDEPDELAAALRASPPGPSQ